MDLLTEVTWSGLPWVAALALFLIALDALLETDWLAIGALAGLSAYFAALLELSAPGRVAAGAVTWVVLVAALQFGWKRLVAPGLRGVLGRGLPEARDEAVGSVGEFRRIDGKAFVYWNGDLWPVDLDGDGAASADADDGRFRDHQQVRIASAHGGVFTVAPLSPSTPSQGART